MAVSIYGGVLYEESQAPAKLLLSVPSEFYNVEVSITLLYGYLSYYSFFCLLKTLVNVLQTNVLLFLF